MPHPKHIKFWLEVLKNDLAGHGCQAGATPIFIGFETLQGGSGCYTYNIFGQQTVNLLAVERFRAHPRPRRGGAAGCGHRASPRHLPASRSSGQMTRAAADVVGKALRGGESYATTTWSCRKNSIISPCCGGVGASCAALAARNDLRVIKPITRGIPVRKTTRKSGKTSPSPGKSGGSLTMHRRGLSVSWQ